MYRNKAKDIAFMLLLSFLVVLTAHAQQAEPVPYSQLSEQQREVFAMDQLSWDNLPANRQQNLLRGFARWQQMTPEQRQRAQTRHQRWKNLPPDQRKRLQKRFKRFESLSPKEKRRVLKARQRFRSLPPERRKQLRRQWRESK